MKKIQKGVSFILCVFLLVGMTQTDTASAYNGQAAADYAGRYYGNYNPAYDSYSSDCTNFTSQCIVAGSFPTVKLPSGNVSYFMLGGTYGTTEYFSHMKYTKKLGIGPISKTKTDFVATTTWTVAGLGSGGISYGFYAYVMSKGMIPLEFSTPKTKINYLTEAASVGDIIQIKPKGSDSTVHSYIVVSKTYDLKNKRYDIGVSAHTGSRNNDDFRTMVEEGIIKSTDTLVLLRITKADMNKMAQKK